jgi:hypothetical protein
MAHGSQPNDCFMNTSWFWTGVKKICALHSKALARVLARPGKPLENMENIRKSGGGLMPLLLCGAAA